MSIEGFVTYPGLNEIQYLRVATRAVGLRANKAIVVTKPQANAPSLTGTLAFGFGGTSVTWTNALCDSAMMRVSRDGQQCFWTILDGRWLHWKAFIHGAYNVRLPDGTIDPDTEKTLAQLLTLLFQAMNATVDVSEVTSSEKPEVVFDHDRVVPEIEELLEQRGYVASYLLDGTYKVYRVGSGATLPNDGDVVSFSNTMNPPEKPQTLRALGAKTRVQSKLHMTPVGLDTDGKIKKVKDLSYTPGGPGRVDGWDGMDLLTFNFVTDPKAQQLALMSVGKWYQVEFQAKDDHVIAGGGVDYVPGELSVTNILQYLPLSDELVETAIDVFGKKRRGKAYVEGTFYLDEENPAPAKNSDPFSRVDRRDWTLDKELGIVKFREPARMIVNESVTPHVFTFADVYLTCSYSIDNALRIKDRYIRDRSLGGSGADQLRVEELERTLICEYGSDNKTISNIIDNEATVDVSADFVLDNAAASYTTSIGNGILYRGIRQYSPDGINLQVVWSGAVPGSAAPYSTFVSQGMESHPLVPNSRERRQKRINERTNLWNSSRGRRYRNSKKRSD